MVATIVPFGSEVYLMSLLITDKHNTLLLLIVASAGNILGSVFNWVCGFYASYFMKKKWFPFKREQINKASKIFSKYGKWSLLLSWVPIIGDPLTFIAGSLKYSFFPFLILVSLGKIGRYLFIYISTLFIVNTGIMFNF